MDIQPINIVIHIINIVVLYVLLRIILYNPIVNYLNARTAQVKASLDQAKKTQDDANVLKADLEKRIQGADDEAQKRLMEGTQRASEQSAEILQQASEQAKALLEESRQKAEGERKQMVQSLEPQISEMAIHLASEVLKREISAEDNKKVIDAFFDKAV